MQDDRSRMARPERVEQVGHLDAGILEHLVSVDSGYVGEVDLFDERCRRPRTGCGTRPGSEGASGKRPQIPRSSEYGTPW